MTIPDDLFLSILAMDAYNSEVVAEIRTAQRLI